MKTVGQLLRSARNQKNLTIDQLSSLTKIDAKYIEALEGDRYDLLPSETFAKGFIRNISLRLERDPGEYIAVFRRDFKKPEEKQTQVRYHHDRSNLKKYFTSQIMMFILGGVVFLGYLGFQFRAILTPPSLNVIRPVVGDVLISPFEIEGQTSVDSVITINNENMTKPDTSGHFLVRLNLPVGEHELEIKATNRFSRVSTKKIPLTIITK